MYSYIGWLVTQACREVFRQSKGIHVVSVNIHNHWLLQLHNNNMWKVCHVLFFYPNPNKAGFRKCKKYRIWDGWKNESDLFPVLIKKNTKNCKLSVCGSCLQSLWCPGPAFDPCGPCFFHGEQMDPAETRLPSREPWDTCTWCALAHRDHIRR